MTVYITWLYVSICVYPHVGLVLTSKKTAVLVLIGGGFAGAAKLELLPNTTNELSCTG